MQYHWYKLVTIIGGDLIVVDNNRNINHLGDARKAALSQHYQGLTIAKGTGAQVNTKLFRLMDEWNTPASEEPIPHGYTEQD